MINLKLHYHNLDVSIVGTPAEDYSINTGDLLSKIESFLRIMSSYDNVSVEIKSVDYNTVTYNDGTIVYTDSADSML